MWSIQICLTFVVAGRILNRFAKDIGFMDELLPTTFTDFNQVSTMYDATYGIIETKN